MRCIFSAFAALLVYFLFSYLEPILAVRIKDFNLSQTQIGVLFVIYPVFYTLFSLVSGMIPNGVQKRATIILASLALAVTNLTSLPSQYLPDYLWIVVVGQITHGILQPLLNVPVLPEMI